MNVLSLSWKSRLYKRNTKELDEVARFVVLDNGCWHVAKEWYLFSGRLERPPAYAHLQSCRTQCPACTGDWHRVHLPVYRSSIVDFLSQHLRQSPYWIEMIFDRATDQSNQHT